MQYSVRLLVVPILLAVAACGGGGAGPNPPPPPPPAPPPPPPPPAPVASVVVSGAAAEGIILVGTTTQLTATVRDAGGTSLNRLVTWSSTNQTLAPVSSTGLVSGQVAGPVTITATSEGVSGSTDMSVRAPIAVPGPGSPTAVTVLGGLVTVTIPLGATSLTQLNVGPATATCPDDRLVPGGAFDFGPSGAQFLLPLSVALKFDPGSIPVDERGDLRVFGAENCVWTEVAGGAVDLANALVSAPVSHFSRYGLFRRAPPTTLAINAGNNQGAAAGAPVPVAPSAIVRDVQARPVPRVSVRFDVASGGGTIAGGNVGVSNASGIATLPGAWNLGPAGGANALTATVVGFSVPPVSFLATATPPASPDLVVDVVTAPAAGSIGATITVLLRVRNQGAATNSAFRAGFYLSADATITTADVLFGLCAYATGLAANTTNDCTGPLPVPGTLPAGTYYVGAIADDQAQINESNEANNTRASATTTILSTVVVSPDLVVDLVTAPATATIGGTIAVLETVRNQGTATTTSFRVGFYLSTDPTITTADLLFGLCSYATGLGANATNDCSGPLPVPNTLPPGTYYVGAIADDQAQVSEANESNNARASATTTVVAAVGVLPDFVVDAVTAPATGTIGSTIFVSGMVHNQATVTTGTFRAGFYLSPDATITTADLLFGACTYPAGMAANAVDDCNGPITVPNTLQPGTYYVGAIADDQSLITESNEANNARASVTTTLLSPAGVGDLVVDAMTAPANGTIGGTISISTRVRNQGTAPTGAFRLGFYYSTDPTITTGDVASGSICNYASGLAANTFSDCSGPITVPGALPPGTYYVGVIADDQGQVNETSESNNARASATTSLLQGSAGLNLVVDGVYLTQAAQTYAGTVPLVAGRAAFLRVFVKASETNSAVPTVRARFYQNSILVDTRILPAEGVSVPTSINEGVLTSSWNLAVAGSLIAPGLSILIDVDPTNTIVETSEGDNAFPASGTPLTLDVRTASTYNVMLIPVVQTPNGLQGDVTNANKATYLDFATRVYPFATNNATVHAPYQFGSTISSSYDVTWSTLLNQMAALRLTEGASQNYYGVLKPSYSSGGTGLGALGGQAAIGVDWTGSVTGSNTNYRSMTAAHEWGHNFGRNHIGCGGPANPDMAYPYATTSMGTYGYDLTLSQLLSPSVYVDLMSYCTPLFISDYTYRAVLDYRATHPGSTISPAPQTSLLIWGRIGPDGVVLEPAFEIDAPPSLPTRPGPYRLQATDGAGRDVFNLSFEGEGLDHLPERQFAFVVPLSPTGARPAALRLFANGRETMLQSPIEAAAPVDPTTAVATASLRAGNGSGSILEWDAGRYPMALVRDPVTGQVLSFARGGRLELAMPGRDLDVTLSDGVTSVRRRMAVTPR